MIGLKQIHPEYGAFILRISLGVMWISHACLKWFVFGISGFEGMLEGIGIPSIFAWPVFLMELVGGILILLGFYGRLVSAILIPILIVATYTHLGNGWVHTSSGGGWEYPLFLVMVSIAHIMSGDGIYSIQSIRKLNNV